MGERNGGGIGTSGYFAIQRHPSIGEMRCMFHVRLPENVIGATHAMIIRSSPSSQIYEFFSLVLC